MEIAENFSKSELEDRLNWLTDESLPEEQRGGWLVVWAARGETPQEIADFAALLRERALLVDLPSDEGIIDVCGTGGDGRQTFNVSTAVAIALASAGVPVAKHGNRGLTSKSGGFDVLEEMGVPVPKNSVEAAEQFKRHGVCFLFAPFYHPTIGRIAPLRKWAAAQGSRTVFNLIGPLLNPARPQKQLLGIARPGLLGMYAAALQSLGVSSGIVACGRTLDGSAMDEFSTTGTTHYVRWGGNLQGSCDREFHPAEFGLGTSKDEEVFRVSSPQESARVLIGVLSGEDSGPCAELVMLNLAAAFLAYYPELEWVDALQKARDVLTSGRGLKLLDELRR